MTQSIDPAIAIGRAIKKSSETTPEMLTRSINVVIQHRGQPKEGFNTKVGGAKLLALAIEHKCVLPLLNSDIEGELNELQVKVLANFALEERWFKGFTECSRMAEKTFQVDAILPGSESTGKPHSIMATAIGANNADQLFSYLEFTEGSIQGVDIVLVNGNQMNVFSMGIQCSGIEGINALLTHISAPLDDELFLDLVGWGLKQVRFEALMRHDQMQQKALPVDAMLSNNSLLATALQKGQFADFLAKSEGTIGAYDTVLFNGKEAPLALIAAGFKQLPTLLVSGRFTGEVDLEHALASQLIHNCIKHGGKEQWEGLVSSGKLVGLFGDFNASVDDIRVNAAGALVQEQKPLVFTLAQNGLLDSALSHLISNGNIDFEAVPDMSKKILTAEEIAQYHQNRLDIGAKTWPHNPEKREEIKFGEEVRTVPPLFMYQINPDSYMLGALFAGGRLQIALFGDVFKDATDYMLMNNLFPANLWFLASINISDDEGMEELATLMSGSPLDASKGKLVHGCLPANVFDKCVAAFTALNKLGLDPLSDSAYYNLTPIPTANATLVTKGFLTEAGIPEESADALLGRSYASGEGYDSWS